MVEIVKLSLLVCCIVCIWGQDVPARDASEESGGNGSASALTFGMSGPFSGPSRGLGYEFYRGGMAALQQAAQRDPYAAKSIRIHCRDDGYNPSPALSNTIAFVEEDDVFALFGYVGTPTTIRVLPLLKHYDVLPLTMLFPFTGAEALRQGPYSAHVWHLRASYSQETKAIVEKLWLAGHRRIAVFFQADSFGRSGLEGIRETLAAKGATIYSEATYHRGDTMEMSYAKAIARLAGDGSAMPDAIICIGAYAPTAGFIRDVRTAGINAVIATLSFVDADNLLQLLRREERRTNIELTHRLVGSQVVPSYEDTQLPAVRAYQEAMERLAAPSPQGVPVEQYTPLRRSMVGLEGYLAATVLLEAVRRMGDEVSRARLPEVLAGMHDFDLGIGAPLRFSAHSHQGLQEVYFTRFEDSRVVPLRTWEWLTP